MIWVVPGLTENAGYEFQEGRNQGVNTAGLKMTRKKIERKIQDWKCQEK